MSDVCTHCPVCDQPPTAVYEDLEGTPMIFLECPLQHPYVMGGHTLMEAISYWNYYISFLVSQDMHHMIDKFGTKGNQSYCRTCKAFTRSLMHFMKKQADGDHLGYALVRQECADCHLTKSVQEAA